VEKAGSEPTTSWEGLDRDRATELEDPSIAAESLLFRLPFLFEGKGVDEDRFSMNWLVFLRNMRSRFHCSGAGFHVELDFAEKLWRYSVLLRSLSSSSLRSIVRAW
jgi:hypothetical protein